MLRLPCDLTAEAFLKGYWQKQALFMPGALPDAGPALSADELAWLATLDDVESRIVHVDRSQSPARYRVESGPFDEDYLRDLPDRDWTLLVHDVEKHVPEMRQLFRFVPFIPDWRIDDLMISYAAPGGGVGPHVDHYDVFLCQGPGVRGWRYTTEPVDADPDASDDLLLLSEFDGMDLDAREGDVIYLPPGVPHWGVAREASMTCSIGMRAPSGQDLFGDLAGPATDAFFEDADLRAEEALPGFISEQAVRRAQRLRHSDAGPPTAQLLGEYATRPKDWLAPDKLSRQGATDLLATVPPDRPLLLHGMALVAYDLDRVYVNGASRPASPETLQWFGTVCRDRSVAGDTDHSAYAAEMRLFMARMGAFDWYEDS